MATRSVLDGLRHRTRSGFGQARWWCAAGLVVPVCGLAAAPDSLVAEDDPADGFSPPVLASVAGEPRPLALPGVPAQWSGGRIQGRVEAPTNRFALSSLDVLPSSLMATAVQQQATPMAPAYTGRQVEGLSYRWWLSSGRSDLGLGVGVLGVLGLRGQGAAPATGESPQVSFQGSVPLVTLGWRYQVNPGSMLYADAYGLPGGARTAPYQGVAAGDLYSAKVGVEWARQHKGWGFERGGLGLQLDGGSKMSLRLHRGGVGVYMRSQF